MSTPTLSAIPASTAWGFRQPTEPHQDYQHQDHTRPMPGEVTASTGDDHQAHRRAAGGRPPPDRRHRQAWPKSPSEACVRLPPPPSGRASMKPAFEAIGIHHHQPRRQRWHPAVAVGKPKRSPTWRQPASNSAEKETSVLSTRATSRGSKQVSCCNQMLAGGIRPDSRGRRPAARRVPACRSRLRGFQGCCPC